MAALHTGTDPMMRNQRGFTFIELAWSLLILVMAGVTISYLVVKWVNHNNDVAAAAQDRAISGQFARYLKAQHDSLLNSSSWPVQIKQSTVAAAGYPIPTQPNAWGQNYQLWIVKDGGGDLQGLVITVGGRTIPSDRVRNIARLITSLGGAGAYVDVAKVAADPGPNYLVGPNGLKLALSTYSSNPGVGHYADAIYLADAVQLPGLANTALQRVAIPGQPDLNTMHTDIDGGGNSARNFKTVNAQNVGAAGMDGASGYPTGWGGGVHTLDVYAEGTVGAGTAGSLLASMDRTGNFRGTNAILTTDVQAGSWFRTTGDGGLYSNKYGIGLYIADPNWVRVYKDAGIYTGGQGQFGSLVANGRLTAQEYIQLNGAANVGWTCSPEGLVGRASDGTGAVQCLSGTWQRMRGMVGADQVVSSASSCGNTRNAVIAQCPAGTRVTGGGYWLNAWRPLSGASSNAPDISAPNGNGWRVQAGAENGNTCFVSYAVCGS